MSMKYKKKIAKNFISKLICVNYIPDFTSRRLILETCRVTQLTMVPDFAAAVRGKKADKFDLLGSPPENFKYM